jgi:hypothetical protein
MKCSVFSDTVPHNFETNSGVLSASHSMVKGGVRGKPAGCEADHLPPTSVELKKTWIYTSTPPIRLHNLILYQEWCLLGCYAVWLL